MIENSEKEVKTVNNTMWKERHQFILSANGNIICQRYFKVHGFNPYSLHSVELYDTVRDVVELIKKDLESKSRVYTGITLSNRSKLTGYYSGEESLSFDDAVLTYSPHLEGKVTLSNGVTLDKTFIDYDEVVEKEDKTPFIFKFSYLFDDNVVYEEIWDGSVYPKYIRNSVDLSNSNSSYKDSDPMNMTFSQQMNKHLNEGRVDLIYHIIKMFSNTLSNDVDEDGNSIEKEYTSYFDYSDKDTKKIYYCTSYPVEYVKGWGKSVRQKTIKYNRWLLA